MVIIMEILLDFIKMVFKLYKQNINVIKILYWIQIVNVNKGTMNLLHKINVLVNFIDIIFYIKIK